jgi:hypothetical protein
MGAILTHGAFSSGKRLGLRLLAMVVGSRVSWVNVQSCSEVEALGQEASWPCHIVGNNGTRGQKRMTSWRAPVFSWTVPRACALNRLKLLEKAIGIYLRWQAAEAARLGSAALWRRWARTLDLRLVLPRFPLPASETFAFSMSGPGFTSASSARRPF